MSARTRRQCFRSTVAHLQPTHGLATTQIPVTFAYHRGDPCAVRIIFHPDDGPDVEWWISRDLLTAGLLGPVGCGDVRLTPHPVMSTHLRLHLTDGDNTATFLIDGVWLDNFLDATYQIVPAGAEYAGYDVDAALAQLCEGAA